MKRLFRTRQQAIDSMLQELHETFPSADFKAIKGEDLPLDIQTLFYFKVYHNLGVNQVKQAVRLHWVNGPTPKEVEEVTSMYERYRFVPRRDGSLERYENTVLTLDGSVKRIGMFSAVILSRNCQEMKTSSTVC